MRLVRQRASKAAKAFSVGDAQANKAAKKALATTKTLAMNELYEELETTESEIKICRIAKARGKATKDVSHIKQINNEHGVV